MTASDGTIWVVTDTTDHGEPFGAHGIIRKSEPLLYEELVHIPLIIRHPEGTPLLPANLCSEITDSTCEAIRSDLKNSFNFSKL